MCEQTEIKYMDGEVVWVKLGSCWWPGQVTGYENLPEDIQTEFRKKQLIAAVKFFQEETYEFVRNLKQIYKYNCTQKDDFIKKGLDKYRSKTKDGTNYMGKFPGDVEMAEKLTNGNPDILKSEKFSPEEKPDIASLFGEKKLPKKKRDKDSGTYRRSTSNILGDSGGRRITHPRFLRAESDHEVRIRQQSTGSLPTTPNSSGDSQLYSCPLCNFTSTRVNVIICHNKSHRQGGWESPLSRSRSYTTHHLQQHQQQPKGRMSLGHMPSESASPKRKYVRKNKSSSGKIMSDRSINESIKRKHTKQIEKIAKKKKSDPELREKLLADWDDETDDEDFDLNKSIDSTEICNEPTENISMKNLDKFAVEEDNNEEEKRVTEQMKKDTNNQKDALVCADNDDDDDGDGGREIIKTSDSSFSLVQKASSRKLNNKFTDTTHSNEQTRITLLSKSKLTNLKKQKTSSDDDNKDIAMTTTESDDKKSKFSCFDFDEEELEPAIIPPVRKIPRVFGEKNTSLKKEIIKEFAMSQALQNERVNEEKRMKNINSPLHDEIVGEEKMDLDKSVNDDDDDVDDDDEKLMKEVNKTVNEASNLVAKIASETKSSNINKSKCEMTETELEIVEILQIEKEKDDEELLIDDHVSSSKCETKITELLSTVTDKSTKNHNETTKIIESSLKMTINEESAPLCDIKLPTKSGEKKDLQKIADDCDRVTIEEEDDTLSISQLTHSVSGTSAITDVDGTLTEMGWSQLSDIIGSNTPTATTATTSSVSNDVEKTAENIGEIEKPTPKRQRGRPRKIHSTIGVSDNGEAILTPMKIIKGDENYPETHDNKDRDRKTSESDTDRSYTGRRRKPNKKYLYDSEIYTQSPGRTPRTDDSQSETEENRPQSERKVRRSTKPLTIKKNIRKSIEEYEFSDQTFDSAEESTSFSSPRSISPTKSTVESVKRDDVMSPMHITDLLASSDVEIRGSDDVLAVNTIKEKNEHVELNKQIETNYEITAVTAKKSFQFDNSRQVMEDGKQFGSFETKVDMLPPKKSQIKKFEMSQIDVYDEKNSTIVDKIVDETVVDNELINEIVTDATIETDSETIIVPVEPEANKNVMRVNDMGGIPMVGDSSISAIQDTMESSVMENGDKVIDSTEVSSPHQSIVAIEEQNRIDDHDERNESATKIIEQCELKRRNTVNSITEFANDFQEDVIKTTSISTESLLNNVESIEIVKTPKIEEKSETSRDSIDQSPLQHVEAIPQTIEINNEISTKEAIEVVEEINDQSHIVPDVLDIAETVSDPSQAISPSSIEQQTGVECNEKSDETTIIQPSTVLTSSSSSEVSVPVKKREKPRIIENVQLKEPMQILKSKLLEKPPSKFGKHKLEHDIGKKVSPLGISRSKIMKMDATNNRKIPKNTQMSLTQKLQVLKDEEAATEMRNEKVLVNSPMVPNTTSTTIITTSTPIEMPTAINVPAGDKFIQQTSSNLEDMELDINSIPFVLSEDLNPDSIEQMPVMISTIIPSASNISTTMAVTTSKMTNRVSQQLTQQSMPTQSETMNVDASPTKKKMVSPAILKNKVKAKPTITSIRTLNPPLTGGVKGLKFQNATTGKATQLMAQKGGTPGKYVIVQTAGGQQVRYTVQGKPGMQQKFPLPAGKNAGNPQIVQQGNKVVILTSPSSGQTKMVPLSIPKGVSGKVQKIIGTKDQVYSQITPPNVVSSKSAAVIAPKSDTNSPTTSKLSVGQKFINQSNIITSKGMITPLTGSKLLGTLSTGLMKSNYTPLTNTPITGKTLIGGKTLVTTKGTILSQISGGQTGNKTILAPISPSTLTGKTLITSQSLVPSKGTVLTPITGQQVKAIAAKNPGKNTKIQYQLQQKIQLPILQKTQKISMSSALSPVRVTGTLKSSGPSGTLVFQNVTQSTQHQLQQQKTPTGKKIIRQHTITSSRSIQTPTTTHQLQQTIVTSPSTIMQRSKSFTSPIGQKSATQRGTRTSKPQQKIVVRKIRDNESSSTIPGITTLAPAVTSPITSKIMPQKSSSATSRIKNQTMKNQQKPIAQKFLPQSSVAVTTCPVSTATSTDTSGAIHQAHITVEKPLEQMVESTNAITLHEITQKIQQEDGSKISTTQPQIMALPTESSDGTQTYVLVTIDEQGQIHPLDNNTLMSLEGTTQNPDGTRTLYIDPSSFGEAGTLDNIVLQFDNNSLSNSQTATNENLQQQQSSASTAGQSESFSSPNQDILAAALANSDFQQEIGLPEIPTATVMATGITQTSLINQTILQSTIIPTSDPISSPSVLETSLTLNQPIMTPLEVPSSVSMQPKTLSSSISTAPSSLGLPITIHNSNIPFITTPADDSSRLVQIPGNSMPDIGEIIENSSGEIAQSDTQMVPITTQYLVLPTLDSGDQIQQQNDAESTATVSYSAPISDNIVIDSSHVQTTPSMPIIDDTYAENVKFTAISIPNDGDNEENFNDVPISDMLIVKSQNIQELSEHERGNLLEDVETISNKQIQLDDSTTEIRDMPIVQDDNNRQETVLNDEYTIGIMQIDPEHNSKIISGCVPPTTTTTVEESCMPSESSNCDVQSSIHEDNDELKRIHSQVSKSVDTLAKMEIDNPQIIQGKSNISLVRNDENDSNNNNNNDDGDDDDHDNGDNHDADGKEQQYQMKVGAMNMDCDEIETGESTQDKPAVTDTEINSTTTTTTTTMTITTTTTTPTTPAAETSTTTTTSSSLSSSSSSSSTLVGTSQEKPSQSYEQSDTTEIPTQSVATKSENSREATQSLNYESMEIDERVDDSVRSDEPPTQSFEDIKTNEASQSYITTNDNNTNIPTQSFNEVISQCQDERLQSNGREEIIDDTSFPTQSYDIGKIENISESLETDGELSHEGNIPSQSNDIANDDGGIGTSSTFLMNNTGLNEDETASSSYVPETPETQERDQDQESAISTSSYEIPTCEEINIASSSIIPDTSMGTEHIQSVHDNGIPEIPTSSYNLNPDSSSSTHHHTDAVPTSSYEDQAVVEQNVSTSYEVPISMPGLEENLSQNFVSESTDHTNQPSSYYAQHVEDVTSEASQSYFVPEGPSPSYTSQNVSPSCYEPPPAESEASQSFYSHDIERTQQSSSTSTTHNIGNIVEVASQSFYQETSDELKLGQQQGEATPTYTERYPVDYTLENSPIDRHDLVESSVPATARPAER